jgi:hypothetical protein
MAPEQAGNSAEVDHRADIYALGVVLYEMLTGERPRTDLVAPSKKVQLDVRIDEMVLRALEKSPELRYQTADEFRTVVETMVGSGERAPAAQLPVAAVAPPDVTSNVALPKNDPVMDTAVAEARKRVAAPAIGLMLVSGLNLLLTGVLGPVLFSHFFFSINHILIPPQGTEFLPDWSLRISLLAILFTGCLSALTFVGAWRMRRLKGYGLAVTAAILALITPPGLLVGLAFGIWALVVLCRRDVQEAFRRTNSTTTGMGCLLACLALLGFVLVMVLTMFGLRALAPRPRSTENPTPVTPAAPAAPVTPATSITPPPPDHPGGKRIETASCENQHRNQNKSLRHKFDHAPLRRILGGAGWRWPRGHWSATLHFAGSRVADGRKAHRQIGAFRVECQLLLRRPSRRLSNGNELRCCDRSELPAGPDASQKARHL